MNLINKKCHYCKQEYEYYPDEDVYHDEESARIKAEQLSIANSNIKFQVLKVIAEVVSQSVKWTEFNNKIKSVVKRNLGTE